MLDYQKNKQIAKAYQKVCEGVNPNGTIDDYSYEKEIVTDCAESLYKLVRTKLINIFERAEPDTGTYQPVAYLEFKNGDFLKDVFKVTHFKLTEDYNYRPGYSKGQYCNMKAVEVDRGITAGVQTVSVSTYLDLVEDITHERSVKQIADYLNNKIIFTGEYYTVRNTICFMYNGNGPMPYIIELTPESKIKPFHLKNIDRFISSDNIKGKTTRAYKSAAFRKNLHKPNIPESVQNESEGDGVRFGTNPIQASVDAVSEDGIGSNDFQLDLNNLEQWLAKVGAVESYDDIESDVLLGTKTTIHLSKPISAVTLLMQRPKG